MSNKLVDYLKELVGKRDIKKIQDEFGDDIIHVQVVGSKAILSTTKPIGQCKRCSGPVYKDNKTSFKYHCANEGINLYDNDVKLIKR